MATYQQAVMADVPDLYWRCNDAGPSSCADTSGNSLTGTATSGTFGATSANARLGTGISFAGIDGRIASGANGIINVTGDITFECWFNSTGISVQQVLVNKFYEGNEAPELSVTSSKLLISRVSAGTTIVAGGTTLLSNTWYHAACTRAGNVWTLYLNGVADGTTTVAVTCFNNTGLMYAGNYFTNGVGLTGTIDEVAVYSHAVTQPRLAFHYAAAFADVSDNPGVLQQVRPIAVGGFA